LHETTHGFDTPNLNRAAVRRLGNFATKGGRTKDVVETSNLDVEAVVTMIR
jgi:hypothetical protein